jgi:hypothetical protein
MAEGQQRQPDEAAAERRRLLRSLKEASESGQPEEVDQIAKQLETLRESHPTIEEETKKLCPDLGEELVPVPTLTVTRTLTPEDRLEVLARQKGDFEIAFNLVRTRRMTPKDIRLAGSEHGGIVRAVAKGTGPAIELKDTMAAQRELEQDDNYRSFTGKLASVARVRAEYKKLAHAFEVRMLNPESLVEWLEEKDRLQSVVSGHRTEARAQLRGQISDQGLLGLAVDEKRKVLLLACVIQAAHATGEPLRGFVRGLQGIEYTSERIVKPSKHDRQKPE